MGKIVKQHPDKSDVFLVEKAVMQSEEYQKTKPDLKEIHNHWECPVAVLGGGPSLPEDLESIPYDSLLISCNHHAFKLVDPDIMVFLDNPNGNYSDAFREKCKTFHTRISYRELDYTDYYCINEFPASLHPLGDTGLFGAWVASYITTGNVYLCGMGLRQPNEPTHFYETGQNTFWGGERLDRKIQKWRQVLSFCENPKRIIPISGPLKYEL